MLDRLGFLATLCFVLSFLVTAAFVTSGMMLYAIDVFVDSQRLNEDIKSIELLSLLCFGITGALFAATTALASLQPKEPQDD